MMITGERLNKEQMMKGLKPGFIRSKLVARNTIKAEYPDGMTIIRYWNTDVVTINPDGSITLNSGGFHTKTTKERIEEYCDISVYQKDSIWTVYTNRKTGHISGREHSMFYDGMIIKDGKIISGIRLSPDVVIKQFKKDLKKLTDMITRDNVQEYFKDMAGDCLICKFDRSSKCATSDHLISHVQEGYMHGSLIWLCLELSGYNPAPHIQMKLTDNIKRSVRKVISDTCIPVLMENPGIYKEVC